MLSFTVLFYNRLSGEYFYSAKVLFVKWQFTASFVIKGVFEEMRR